MPRSRYVSAQRLKALLGYFAAAFLCVLAVGVLVPAGSTRTLLTFLWIVGFPVGGWWVFRRIGE